MVNELIQNKILHWLFLAKITYK